MKSIFLKSLGKNLETGQKLSNTKHAFEGTCGMLELCHSHGDLGRSNVRWKLECTLPSSPKERHVGLKLEAQDILPT